MGRSLNPAQRAATGSPRGRSERLTVGSTAFLLACVCLLPLAALAELMAEEVFAASTVAILPNSTSLHMLVRSVLGAALVTLGTLALGIPTGVILYGFNMPGKRLAAWVHALPLCTSPFILALGWHHTLGRQGTLGSVGGAEFLYSPAGAVFTLILALTPIVSGMTFLGARAITSELVEAGQVVQPPHRVALNLVLPLSWPATCLGALAVFALALAETAVPLFLRVPTYSTLVFSRLGAVRYTPGLAVASLLPVAGIALVLALVERRWLRVRSNTSLHPKSPPNITLPLGRVRGPVTLVLWAFVSVGLTPLVSLAAQAGWTGLLEASQWLGSSVETSLVMSGLGATLCLTLCTILGHALSRDTQWLLALETATLVAFFVPGSVLGVGNIVIWNRPSTQWIYGSVAILALGLTARYAGLALRITTNVFARTSTDAEEAATCAGSVYWVRMVRLVLPMHWRPLAMTWLLLIVLFLRDLDTVIAFYPPGLEPLLVRLFTLEANGSRHMVAGLALYPVALSAALLWAGGHLLRERLPSPP